MSSPPVYDNTADRQIRRGPRGRRTSQATVAFSQQATIISAHQTRSAAPVATNFTGTSNLNRSITPRAHTLGNYASDSDSSTPVKESISTQSGVSFSMQSSHSEFSDSDPALIFKPQKKLVKRTPTRRSPRLSVDVRPTNLIPTNQKSPSNAISNSPLPTSSDQIILETIELADSPNSSQSSANNSNAAPTENITPTADINPLDSTLTNPTELPTPPVASVNRDNQSTVFESTTTSTTQVPQISNINSEVRIESVSSTAESQSESESTNEPLQQLPTTPRISPRLSPISPTVQNLLNSSKSTSPRIAEAVDQFRLEQAASSTAPTSPASTSPPRLLNRPSIFDGVTPLTGRNQAKSPPQRVIFDNNLLVHTPFATPTGTEFRPHNRQATQNDDIVGGARPRSKSVSKNQKIELRNIAIRQALAKTASEKASMASNDQETSAVQLQIQELTERLAQGERTSAQILQLLTNLQPMAQAANQQTASSEQNSRRTNSNVPPYNPNADYNLGPRTDPPPQPPPAQQTSRQRSVNLPDRSRSGSPSSQMRTQHVAPTGRTTENTVTQPNVNVAQGNVRVSNNTNGNVDRGQEQVHERATTQQNENQQNRENEINQRRQRDNFRNAPGYDPPSDPSDDDGDDRNNNNDFNHRNRGVYNRNANAHRNEQFFDDEEEDLLPEQRISAQRKELIDRHLRYIRSITSDSSSEISTFVKAVDITMSHIRTIDENMYFTQELKPKIARIDFIPTNEITRAIIWIDLKGLLLKEYNATNNKTSLDAQLVNLNQTHTETVEEFGARARKLAHQFEVFYGAQMSDALRERVHYDKPTLNRSVPIVIMGLPTII